MNSPKCAQQKTNLTLFANDAANSVWGVPCYSWRDYKLQIILEILQNVLWK